MRRDRDKLCDMGKTARKRLAEELTQAVEEDMAKNDSSSWVHIEVDEIKASTDKAFLFDIGGEEVWIPKSQVSDPDDYDKGDENVTVSVTEWIAKQKNLDY